MLLTAVVLVASCLGGPAGWLGGTRAGARQAAPPLDRSRDALVKAVQPMLTARADAFRRHDVDAYLATVDGRNPVFLQQQREAVEFAAGLNFSLYALTANLDDLGDMSVPADLARFGPDTVVVPVEERYAFAGGVDDQGPAVESLFLTMTRDAGGTWRVAADDAVDAAGLQSARHPWDYGLMRTRSSEHFLAIYPDNQAREVAAVLSESETAIRTTIAEWTLPWRRKVAIEIPRDTESLADRILATFPLDNFVAFAGASAEVEGTVFRFTGRRVFLQPDNFLGQSTEQRRATMSHELIHVASREQAGPYVPSWLEEGVAQVLGENASAVGLGPARDAVRSGRFDGHVPDDYEFVVGGAQRIYQSYAESYLMAREVQKIAGKAGLLRLYEAAGNGGRLGPGDARAHIDAAVRKALGMSFAELERRWAADMRANALR